MCQVIFINMIEIRQNIKDDEYFFLCLPNVLLMG